MKKKRKEEIEVIIPTMRGKSNDCFGYCIECPQVNIQFQSKEKQDIFYYTCNLPEAHTIKLKGKR